MRLVSKSREIINNLLELERCRQSTDLKAQAAYKLLGNGFCFVAYGSKGQVYFGPSRFIGYVNNTINKHIANKGSLDGRETNVAIERVLGEKFTSSKSIEDQFKSFCTAHGLAPAKRQRKYIGAGNLILTDADSLRDDFIRIDNNPNLSETEKKRLADSRIGQGIFRDRVLSYWRRCPITECQDTRLLRASHIKPWSQSNNIERLDMYNGILLSPNLDAAFDSGLISFKPNGDILISKSLKPSDAKRLGIHGAIHLEFHKKHTPYLQYHFSTVFEE